MPARGQRARKAVSRSEQDPSGPQPVAAAQVAPLHMLDRSRLMLGWQGCPRARYLEYHGPPTGYGIRLKAQSIPLATGTYLHSAAKPILEACRATGRPADRSVVRAAVTAETRRYRALVEARGFQGEGQERVDEIVQEQAWLIECMVWGWWKCFLPAVLEEYVIVLIEEEAPYIVGCGCGLGNGVGEPEEHARRGCGGKHLMTRSDLVLQRKSDGALALVDLKTTGEVGLQWRVRWEDNPQIGLNALGAESKLGREIQFAWIHGFFKGRREAAYDPQTKKRDGPKYQNSIYCYAYYREANPPIQEADVQLRWEWQDEFGASHRLSGKNYEKRPARAIVKAIMQAPGATTWTPAEIWVESLPEAEIRKQYELVGPLPIPRRLLEKLTRAIDTHESRVVAGLWAIHDVMTRVGGDTTHPDYLAVLDDYFPQNWDCWPFKGECQFQLICKERSGWEDPLGSGLYELRRPHHEAELQQVIVRGIELPPEQDEGEE